MNTNTAGSFGEVYLAVNTADGVEVAIKVEALKAAHPQLAYEARLLSLLRGNLGVSHVYYSGMQKGYYTFRFTFLLRFARLLSSSFSSWLPLFML